MRLGAFHARLQAIDPTRNSTNANIHNRLPPNRDCAQPTNGIVTPSASRYPVLTHWIVDTAVSNCAASVCSATLTIVVSKTTASPPTISTVAILTTFGSIGSLARVTVVMPSPFRYRTVSTHQASGPR